MSGTIHTYLRYAVLQMTSIATAHGLSQENTCNIEHNAILKAGLRKEGYLASGVGAVLCARHSLARPNGIGDLQKGEK